MIKKSDGTAYSITEYIQHLKDEIAYTKEDIEYYKNDAEIMQNLKEKLHTMEKSLEILEGETKWNGCRIGWKKWKSLLACIFRNRKNLSHGVNYG